ncbi:hypothetical protein AX14_000485 [Amanita brunnescens Koide BX004]|nr:hypothetical protein AX14_000485 [Amanita brunnescens Koide BX004]
MTNREGQVGHCRSKVPIRCIQTTTTLSPLLRASPRAVILNMSTDMASNAIQTRTDARLHVIAYNTSKAAANSYTIALAQELRKEGIRCHERYLIGFNHFRIDCPKSSCATKSRPFPFPSGPTPPEDRAAEIVNKLLSSSNLITKTGTVILGTGLAAAAISQELYVVNEESIFYCFCDRLHLYCEDMDSLVLELSCSPVESENHFKKLIALD